MSREAILHHLVDVVASEGTAGLTVRRVAASAGVAIGTVQHYFPTKSAMLLAAIDIIGATASQAYSNEVVDPDPEEHLLELVQLLIPRDRDSRVARVWLAFAAHSVVDPVISARYREIWASLHRRLTASFLAASTSAEGGAEADEAAATAAATELLALADGLAVAVLAEPERVSPDQARSIAIARCRDLLAALR